MRKAAVHVAYFDPVSLVFGQGRGGGDTLHRGSYLTPGLYLTPV